MFGRKNNSGYEIKKHHIMATIFVTEFKKTIMNLYKPLIMEVSNGKPTIRQNSYRTRLEK